MAEQTDPALIAKANGVASRKFLCGPYQRLPARAVEPLDQCRLDFRLGLPPDAAAVELRLNYLGVVDDELIARLKPGRKIAYDLITQNAVALHDQHARGVARAHWAQRDAVDRKIKIEEIGAHA